MCKNKVACSIYCSIILFCFTINNGYPQQFDAVVSNTNTTITVNKDKVVEEYSIDVTINNRRGENNSKFEINYNKSEKIKNIKAWIEDEFGNIVRKLSNNEIITVSAVSDFSLYEDDFIKYFNLRHNTYPYKIHMEYTREYDQFLYLADWSPVYNSDIPTLKASLTLDTPIEYTYKVSERNIEQPIYSSSLERKSYTWNSHYLKPFDYEVFCPPQEILIPKVYIVPNQFTFGITGSFDSWESYGDWQARLMEGLQEIPLSEKMQVDKILKSSNDVKQRILSLYQYLQNNTRYINVTIDIGGMRPYPASYVSHNKYGDCKALSNYMLSLLKYAGIKAYYAKVYAGDEIIPINKNFPSQQFNHVILFIPLETDTIWLDCTNKYIPVNYLGTFSQGRDAFIIDSNNSRFVTTPFLKENDVRTVSNFSFHLNNTSLIRSEIKKELRGNNFELYQRFSKEINTNYQEQIIREMIESPDFELTEWSLTKPNIDSAIIILDLKLEIGGMIKKYGNDYIVKSPKLELPKFEPVAKRKLDVIINYPISTIDTIRYYYPQNLEISHIPQPTLLETKYGKYITEYNHRDRIVELVRKIIIYPGHYKLSEYTDFYSFIQKINTFENQNLILFK